MPCLLPLSVRPSTSPYNHVGRIVSVDTIMKILDCCCCSIVSTALEMKWIGFIFLKSEVRKKGSTDFKIVNLLILIKKNNKIKQLG